MSSEGQTLAAVLEAVPSGGSVYLDRDWIWRDSETMVSAALWHDPVRGFRWGPGEWVAAEEGLDSDGGAFAYMNAMAAAAVSAAAGAGPLSVTGEGLLAHLSRSLVGDGGSSTADTSPRVTIETTGRSAGLLAATAATADLGTVLLTTSPLGGTVPLDMYADVHRRGLRLVGIPDITGVPRVAAPPGLELGALTGDFLGSGARWFVARD